MDDTLNQIWGLVEDLLNMQQIWEKVKLRHAEVILSQKLLKVLDRDVKAYPFLRVDMLLS